MNRPLAFSVVALIGGFLASPAHSQPKHSSRHHISRNTHSQSSNKAENALFDGMTGLDERVQMYNLYITSAKMDAQAYDTAQYAMQPPAEDPPVGSPGFIAATKALEDSTDDPTARAQGQKDSDKAQISLMSDLLKANKMIRVLLRDKRLMRLYYFGSVTQIARAYPANLPQSVRAKIITRPLIPYPRVVIEH